MKGSPPSTLPPKPLPAPLGWAAGSQTCPACEVVHDTPCAKFWAAYRAYNDQLRERLRSIPTPIPPRPPRCRCGKPRRPFDALCETCEDGKRGAA